MKFYQRFVFCFLVFIVVAVVLLKKNSINRSQKKNIVSKPSSISQNVKSYVDINEEKSRLLLDFEKDDSNIQDTAFKIAANWVEDRQIYPRNHPELSTILKLMATKRIVVADVLPKGTQIKLLLTLEGGQKVVFKQKRYDRDYVVEGKAYDGYDRHNAEIAAFHLDRLLDFRRAPLVVGRFVNLVTEIQPVATQALSDTFRKTEDGRLCYFGKCLYCKEKEMACAGPDNIMEGSVTLWLPEQWSHFTKLRHPYQRTYKEGKTALWERDENYCNSVVKVKPPYDHGDRLLDITDGAAFDYLIGNADRHHYEIFKNNPNSMMLMLDNAKSFGNPYLHESSILAPIRQCCILRSSTYDKLISMESGVLVELLTHAMKNDPIAPILNEKHLHAMQLRLTLLIATIEHCIAEHGKKNVLLDTWNGPL